MSNSSSHVESVTDHRMSGEDRKLLASTLAGTTIEWYDFFIYAQAASLVLGPLFLVPVSADAPGLATIISLATIGISFLFRPLGAIVAGRFGDRLGRKKMLVFTLLLYSPNLEQRDLSGSSDNALYWYFMTGVWIPLAAMVFLSPYLL